MSETNDMVEMEMDVQFNEDERDAMHEALLQYVRYTIMADKPDPGLDYEEPSAGEWSEDDPLISHPAFKAARDLAKRIEDGGKIRRRGGESGESDEFGAVLRALDYMGFYEVYNLDDPFETESRQDALRFTETRGVAVHVFDWFGIDFDDVETTVEVEEQ